MRSLYSYPINSHELYNKTYCGTSPLKCLSSESVLFGYICWILGVFCTFSTLSHSLPCPSFIVYTDRRGNTKRWKVRHVQQGRYVIPWTSKLSIRPTIHKSWSKWLHCMGTVNDTVRRSKVQKNYDSGFWCEKIYVRIFLFLKRENVYIT